MQNTTRTPFGQTRTPFGQTNVPFGQTNVPFEQKKETTVNDKNTKSIILNNSEWGICHSLKKGASALYDWVFGSPVTTKLENRVIEVENKKVEARKILVEFKDKEIEFDFVDGPISEDEMLFKLQHTASLLESLGKTMDEDAIQEKVCSLMQTVLLLQTVESVTDGAENVEAFKDKLMNNIYFFNTIEMAINEDDEVDAEAFKIQLMHALLFLESSGFDMGEKGFDDFDKEAFMSQLMGGELSLAGIENDNNINEVEVQEQVIEETSIVTTTPEQEGWMSWAGSKISSAYNWTVGNTSETKLTDRNVSDQKKSEYSPFVRYTVGAVGAVAGYFLGKEVGSYLDNWYTFGLAKTIGATSGAIGGYKAAIYLLENGSIDGTIAIAKGMAAGLLVGMASVVIMGLCGLAPVLAGSMGAIVCLLILSTLVGGLVAYQIRQYTAPAIKENVTENTNNVTTTSNSEGWMSWAGGKIGSAYNWTMGYDSEKKITERTISDKKKSEYSALVKFAVGAMGAIAGYYLGKELGSALDSWWTFGLVEKLGGATGALGGYKAAIYLLENGSVDGAIAMAKGAAAGLLVAMSTVVLMGLCGLAPVLVGSMGAIVCLLLLSTLAGSLVAYQIRQYYSEPTEDLVPLQTEEKLEVVSDNNNATTTSTTETENWWSGLTIGIA
ncbi:MAG: hypothetical protein COZ46_00695 [Verrucomicrobia bacterium CG_4_10_14_3_um_filter_43_23]|nr:MAG: hypothetical protein AUJ82_02135 [Verrucomicrobia bacterium CG1_02_43_26]PIP59740.1 MAG: hypothetical protein COX01_02225 [Verrucomicrobia bacterium CG22_combo_CG10-13_8_21_14_all_43_17]PIX59054.1 MAG: hypothetical protein COZ46_00695 [Verrucomicrobia bacterium CG_4_10_14_3_um_filter_43_23]PIY62543.1 MAG: hypothetical protein COY94_01935 [Verrucomicrobia bacterium CG_4_10_14_0_8_um_filter_43_34]PJA44637.1 MAG: hypothetical protein CO175_01690 [Verrucomicrobia bacterium CG_4_9_14_3_um_fi